MLKNWCLWTVVLEKTPESPLGSKEIKLINLKRNQPWIFTERTDANSLLIEKVSDAVKNWGQKEKRASEDEMAGWYHQCNGHALGKLQEWVRDREASGCYNTWGHKEFNITGWLNNNSKRHGKFCDSWDG